jgi:hypothetical protein
MNKALIRVAALGACCSILFAAPSTSAQHKKASKGTVRKTKVESKPMPEQPIACNLLGLTASERQRQQDLRTKLFSAQTSVRELSDGYAIGLPATRENILAVAEFISLERLCCSFFRFEMAVGQSEEPVWLRITGRNGVKEFLKTVLMSK